MAKEKVQENLIHYLRLSSEDQYMKSSGQTESHSISNQRSILQEYTKSHVDLQKYNIIELVDDGYSGTNFDRPGISKALAMLRSGEACGIIVKDLSRFGRNYIDVCNYLEQVFPFLGIRFISVNDGYDSSDPACVGSMLTVFKTMFADLYSKDLSAKVKSGLAFKAKQGKFLSASAPYGYTKSETEMNTLVIDEPAAEIIRYIFHSFADGINKNEIARELNRQGVETPMQYKEKIGHTQSWERMVKGDRPLWTGYTILKILQDRRYIGTVVYGKTQKPSFRSSKQMKVDKTDWIVSEDMHEGLVTKELFEKVQALARPYRFGEKEATKTALERKIECAVCGRTLTLIRAKDPFYYCKTRQYTDEFSCKDLHLSVLGVYHAVLSSIRLNAEFAVNVEEVLRLSYQGRKNKIAAKKATIKRFEKELSRWEITQKELLQAFFKQEISKEYFHQELPIVTAKRSNLAEELKLHTEELYILQNDVNLNNRFVQSIKSYQFIQELTDDVIGDLIEKIKVQDADTIEIMWKFSN